MAKRSDWTGGLTADELEGLRAQAGSGSVTPAQLVAKVLAEDDDDPRADRNRLRDPQAHDTRPDGLKMNTIFLRSELDNGASKD